jgi:hypothetical protein
VCRQANLSTPLEDGLEPSMAGTEFGALGEELEQLNDSRGGSFQVRKEGRRKLEPVTFPEFAREWLDTYPATKDLKRSTRESYKGIVEGHLIPELGGYSSPQSTSGSSTATSPASGGTGSARGRSTATLTSSTR